jgi:hypothetical protein
MSDIALLVLTILLGIAFWISVVRPRHALFGAVFLAPWQGLDPDFGLRLTAYQVFILPLTLLILIRPQTMGARKSGVRGVELFLFLILYSALWTLAQIPFLPEMTVSGGMLRAPEVRSMLQIVMLMLSVAPIFLVPRIVRGIDDVVMMGKVYLLSVFVLAVLGWFQLLVWYGTGMNPFPIGIVDNLMGGMAEVRESSYEYLNLSVHRMNSFGGEPKNLGGAFVIAILMIQVVMVNSIFQNVRRLIWLWGFLFASMVATLSTTAFFLWALGTLAHSIVGAFSRGRIGRGDAVTSIISVGRIVVLLVLLIAALVYVLQGSGIPIIDMVFERTVGRLNKSQIGVFEDFDDAIKNYLFDHPIEALMGVGLGNIHLYAGSYLLPEVARYAAGKVFVAKAQYLRLISEVGIIGLALFMAWMLRLLMSVNASVATINRKPFSKTMTSFGAASTLIFLAAGSGAPQFYLTAGALLAFIRISRLNLSV